MPGTTRKSAPKKAPSAPRTPKADVEVTSISSWKKQKEGTPLELPSGNVIRVRNASFQTFMRVGIIPNSLMSVVQSSIDKGKEPAMDDLVGNEKQLNDMVQMVDDVFCFVAIEPKVHRIPTESDVDKWNAEHPDELVESPDDLRKDNVLYVDEVDDEDKMFVFGVCTGGTRDVEQFRSESANSLAALQRS